MHIPPAPTKLYPLTASLLYSYETFALEARKSKLPKTSYGKKKKGLSKGALAAIIVVVVLVVIIVAIVLLLLWRRQQKRKNAGAVTGAPAPMVAGPGAGYPDQTHQPMEMKSGPHYA